MSRFVKLLLLTLILAALAPALSPAAEPPPFQDSGEQTVGCLTVTWRVQEGMVSLRFLSDSGQTLGAVTLGGMQPNQQINFAGPTCKVEGSLAYTGKTPDLQGSVTMEATVTSGETRMPWNGQVAAW